MAETSKGVLLVVDDEPLNRATLQIELSAVGYQVIESPDAIAALKILTSRPVDIVLSDIRMPEMDGLTFLEQIKSRSPETHVILMTAYGSVDAAVDAIKRGAYDYVTKPFNTDEVIEKIDRLLAGRTATNGKREAAIESLGQLVGRSYASRRLFEQVRAVADNERAILIRGEVGTRRDRVAETVHELSQRSSGPLVKFSCAAAAPETLEVELFGQEKMESNGSGGAEGLCERAAGGTLFLDDVDVLPIEVQTRLLLAMEQGAFERVRGSQRIELSARLICATRQDLRSLVDTGMFREDLYYRLDAIRLEIPPLRDRREDVPVLVDGYLQSRCGGGKTGATIRVSPHTMDVLMTYHWPGNIRELEHVIDRALPYATGSEIQPRDILLPTEAPETVVEGTLVGTEKTGLTETIAGVERSLIDAALQRMSGNQAKAAKILGIPRTTLRDKMTKYGMVGKAGRE